MESVQSSGLYGLYCYNRGMAMEVTRAMETAETMSGF